MNPCTTTTLNSITISTTDSTGPYSKAVTDGSTMTVTFVRPTTAAEDTNGIAQVCGVTSYGLYADNSGTAHTHNAAWAVIGTPTNAGVYTLTIDTTADLDLIGTEAQVTIPLYIKATLDDYNTISSYTLLNVVINEVTCDCASLAWDAPTTGVDITSTVLLAAAVA